MNSALNNQEPQSERSAAEEDLMTQESQSPTDEGAKEHTCHKYRVH